MVKRIIAIAFIFACTTAAWMILGATVFSRTNSSDQRLRGRVASTWGTAQEQRAPDAFIERTETRLVDALPERGRERAALSPRPTATMTTTATTRAETIRIRIPAT